MRGMLITAPAVFIFIVYVLKIIPKSKRWSCFDNGETIILSFQVKQGQL